MNLSLLQNTKITEMENINVAKVRDVRGGEEGVTKYKGNLCSDGIILIAVVATKNLHT